MNNDVNDHSAFALAVGMGSTQGPAAAAPSANGTGTMEDIQHFMASKLLNRTSMGVIECKGINQNGNENQVPSFRSTNYCKNSNLESIKLNSKQRF